MGDRDERSQRDARADRYGVDAEHPLNDVSGGRYNRARYRREEAARDPFQAHEGDDDGGGTGDAQDPHFHRSRHPRNEGGGGYGSSWAPNASQPFPFPPYMHPNGGEHMAYAYPNPMMMMMPSLPGQPQGFYMGGGGGPGMSGMGMGGPYGFAPNNNNGGSGGMSSEELLQFLLQQQQHPSASPTTTATASSMMGSIPSAQGTAESGDASATGGGDAATAAPRRPLPSVEEFVPVVPKSLMNLVMGDGMGGGGGGAAAAAASSSAALPGRDGHGGALVLLEAPKISPEADHRAREQRRAHVSGFPQGTTREELTEYFRLLMPEVRRLMTEREIRQLAEETGLLRDEGEEAVRHVAANANLTNIDELRSITVNPGRVKSFCFIELRLADMIDELIQQCATDPNRFLFTSSLDGQMYPLMVRRPRDVHPLTGVDPSKVALIGFPPSMPEDSVKQLFDSYGTLHKFDLKNAYAYGEFETLRDAMDFRADVHGVVLGNSMVVALPLHDWLKALLVREGIDVTVEDDDPVSGKHVMKQVRERLPERSALGGMDGGSGGAATDKGGDGGDSTALVVLASDPEAASLQVMRELLDMSFTLPDILVRFAALYPHLRPLYANVQVTMFATPVLVLMNLFDEEELVFDSRYSALLADIEEEVEKYGRVKRLIVPRREARPKLPEAPKFGAEDSDGNEEDAAAMAAAKTAYEEAKRNFGAVLGRYMTRQTHPVWGGYGRVFVEYETVDEAAEAQQHIAGKLFGERTVVTSFLFPDLLKDDDDDEAEAKSEVEEEEPEDVDKADGEAGTATAAATVTTSKEEGEQREREETAAPEDAIATTTRETPSATVESID